eukprot:scaffold231842_cov32-Tisochrysis_lutea.AAC.2
MLMLMLNSRELNTEYGAANRARSALAKGIFRGASAYGTPAQATQTINAQQSAGTQSRSEACLSAAEVLLSAACAHVLLAPVTAPRSNRS